MNRFISTTIVILLFTSSTPTCSYAQEPSNADQLLTILENLAYLNDEFDPKAVGAAARLTFGPQLHDDSFPIKKHLPFIAVGLGHSRYVQLDEGTRMHASLNLEVIQENACLSFDKFTSAFRGRLKWDRPNVTDPVSGEDFIDLNLGGADFQILLIWWNGCLRSVLVDQFRVQAGAEAQHGR